jgi:galactose-1-phosphate uridylyltransferase
VSYRSLGDEPLQRLPDGTVKQVSPLTGTVVWTVPGRGGRPLAPLPESREPVDPAARDRLCSFCAERYLETTPEKSRLVMADGGPQVLEHVTAPHLFDTVAELRRIPNLYEILSVEYWRANHGFQPSPAVLARATAYTADPVGRTHVLDMLGRRASATGLSGVWATESEAERLAEAVDLFAGSHDVVIARRHLVDGATYLDELAGSGTLTPEEHLRYVAFTIDAMRSLYETQPHARYVSVFQNWLRPAGASFDHLHKQLVAIDEYGPQTERELARLAAEPDVYTTAILDHAAAHRLVVAENEHAIAVAGVGHRYPALEVYSRSHRHLPWEHTRDELRGVSDLLHAVHAATGVSVPTNEEWHYRPPLAGQPMPFHVVLKWRVSTLAGFEGGTKINVNTVDPFTLRDRTVAALRRLRDEGRVAVPAIGDECSHAPGALRYAD